MSSPAIPYPRLSSHLNVWNSCLHLLQRAGYALSTEEVSADGDVLWLARRDGYTLMADNPIELLGSVDVLFSDRVSSDLGLMQGEKRAA
ncbi:hypothetical protein [Parachitinimonas caeni]|uniref:Uncharacterized protein n=1 Tax=Parachitinimonas caeni TaxID=3031301 RepID=A0ABT7DZQ6_9NEIS|nr:hypothetical protein [Parachitinimonas caeni]MDK2124122.1 hypothetical protein [Parachitinimonas caeni]